MWPNPQETADLITFTEKNLNGKLNFLCSEFFGVNRLLEIKDFTLLNLVSKQI